MKSLIYTYIFTLYLDTESLMILVSLGIVTNNVKFSVNIIYYNQHSKVQITRKEKIWEKAAYNFNSNT